ncbi:hypothetical protein D9756_009603 [Leucocoprinus leucothites]|uniref:RING-type domain-containing protein n=1 Tax=Leucocoprinus leucothites TaxID=201217 RepID=A0A8H5FTE1_9AGAR|nr:hypothetical protein D9756_009603 [Leucoagaricus leucothites]
MFQILLPEMATMTQIRLHISHSRLTHLLPRPPRPLGAPKLTKSLEIPEEIYWAHRAVSQLIPSFVNRPAAMDPEEHPEYNYSDHGADDAMHAESLLGSESIPASNEIEMREPSNTSGSTSIGAQSTQHTSMDVSLPASPSGAPAFIISNEMSPPTPSGSQRTSMRRSRVEDDHDHERDRRHPSERIGSSSHPTNTPQLSASSSSSSQPTSTPISRILDNLASGTPRSPPSSGSRLDPFHFFRNIIPHSRPSNPNQASPSLPSQSSPNSSQQGGPTTGPSSGPAPVPIAAAPQPSDSNTTSQTPRVNVRHQYLGGFTIMIDVNGGMTTAPLPGTLPLPTSPNANTTQGDAPPLPNPIPGVPLAQAPRENTVRAADQQEAQTPQQPRTQPQGAPAEDDPQAPLNNAPEGVSAFADVLARIGLLAALSFRDSALFERDVEDPERAKKLVEGLEDVPVGLVRRLERVGKTDAGGGESTDTAEGGLGDGGCAICWERLLLEVEEQKEEGATDKDKDEEPEQSAPSNQSDRGASSSTSQLDHLVEDSDLENRYQRIVTLPCAHVFHAQCLIPWFSKPKQTTCPICRFNIDPENLTYTSRAQRATARAQEQQQGDGEGGDAPQDGGPEAGVGLDIPLMFAGGAGDPPIIIPLGGNVGVPNSAQPPAPAPTGTDARAQDRTGDTENTGTNTNANRNRPPNGDVVTIGFDMYIGRGPPPFPLGGPNIFQIPVPGRPTGANDAPSGDVPNDPSGIPSGAAGNNNPNTTSQGNSTSANAQAGVGAGEARGPPGATLAIPIPMGPGLGRAIGDVLTRIILGTGGNAPAAPGGQAGPAGPTSGQAQPPGPTGPTPFGPERPPTMLPGGIPIPGGVGFGFGAGPVGGAGVQSMPIPPFVLPFGNHSMTMGPGASPLSAGGSLGGLGGPGVQPGRVPPAMGAGPNSIFNIVSGLFGGPSASGQGQGRGQAAPSAPDAQPPFSAAAQPQARRAQDAPQQAPAGFGSASPPMPRQPTPRRKWAPPPPPGLTLRQRVEKKEQEAGLRCCDVSCGVGPSDEDPWIDISEHGLKQLSIRASPSPEPVEKMSTIDSGVGLDGEGGMDSKSDEVDAREVVERKSVCPHTFHSSCLVSSERVALALRNTEVAFMGSEGKEEVEVSCPVGSAPAALESGYPLDFIDSGINCFVAFTIYQERLRLRQDLSLTGDSAPAPTEVPVNVLFVQPCGTLRPSTAWYSLSFYCVVLPALQPLTIVMIHLAQKCLDLLDVLLHRRRKKAEDHDPERSLPAAAAQGRDTPRVGHISDPRTTNTVDIFRDASHFVVESMTNVSYTVNHNQTEDVRRVEEYERRRKAEENAREAEEYERHRKTEEDERWRKAEEALQELKARRLLGAMLDTEERGYVPRCNEDTRQSLRRHIVEWGQNDGEIERLLWLSGPAGVGKSAVAQTVAEELKKVELLGAIFFFSRPNNRSDPSDVIPTLVYQLAVLLPKYKLILGQLLKEDPSVFGKSRRSQFKELISDPFLPDLSRRPLTLVSYLSEQLLTSLFHRPLLIVLDGLDECNGRDVQCEFVEMIARHACTEGPGFPAAVDGICSHERLEVDDDEAQKDALHILREGFTNIRQRYPGQLPHDWPHDGKITFIAERASGHLGFASFIISFIGDQEYDNPSRQLKICLKFLQRTDPSNRVNPLHPLDLLYTQILSDIPEDTLPDTQLVLGLLILYGNERLTALVHANFLGLDQAAFYNSLRRLHSVVFVPPAPEASTKPIRVYHASFTDFLRDKARAKEFVLDEGAIHLYVATRGLKWLSHFSQEPSDQQALPEIAWPGDSTSPHAQTTFGAVCNFAFAPCWRAFPYVPKGSLLTLIKALKNFDFNITYSRWEDETREFAHFIQWLVSSDAKSLASIDHTHLGEPEKKEEITIIWDEEYPPIFFEPFLKDVRLTDCLSVHLQLQTRTQASFHLMPNIDNDV